MNDIMDQEQFVERMRTTVNQALDSFLKEWPGDLLPDDYAEWITRFDKHCEKKGFFKDLIETQSAN